MSPAGWKASRARSNIEAAKSSAPAPVRVCAETRARSRRAPGVEAPPAPAPEIERLAPRAVRELEMAADEPEAEKPERHVDEEDRRPPELVGEESPQRRSEQGSQHRRESDQRDGAGAALAREERHEDSL